MGLTIILPETSDCPCAVLHPHFLSFTIDISILLGGHWWGRSKKMVKGVACDRIEKLNLTDKRLRSYTRLLAPAIIRIGGTEADRVRYKPGAKAVAELDPQAANRDNKNVWESYEYTLTKGLWKRLHNFLKKTGMELLFTVSAGLSDRDKNGAWQETNARKLIAYSVMKRYKVSAWEFGNEINGFPFIYGWQRRITPAQYARDFARFGNLVKSLAPESLIVGPASAVWPLIGEPYPIIKKLCKSPSAVFLDAVSWHYYPQQSSRGKIAIKRANLYSLTSSRALNELVRRNNKIKSSLENANRIRPASSPAANWLTETGHALYGGEPDLSDTFVSSLWWLDELGVLAREGVARVFRQSLIGASYGLLDEETLEARPDFYASFLWKRLMGDSVHIPRFARPGDSKIRVYVHKRGEKRVSILIINLDKRKSASTALEPPINTRVKNMERYLLQGIRGLSSKSLLLNGVPLEDDLVFTWGKKKTIRKYRIKELSEQELSLRFILPPFTVLFLVFSTPVAAIQ